MTTVTIHQAKTQLSKLLVRASAGEEIVIARGKIPVARLQPLPVPKRAFGSMKGRFTMRDDFDDPLPEEELAAWER